MSRVQQYLVVSLERQEYRAKGYQRPPMKISVSVTTGKRWYRRVLKVEGCHKGGELCKVQAEKDISKEM